MQSTYETAITQVFKDEGGYTNDPRDPGGPTNWGITLEDAHLYWNHAATAEDVKNMSKSIAEGIYVQHYAKPLHYDDLPSGVDYAVLDFGINSGISRSAKFLQRIVGVKDDGVIGPITLEAVLKMNSDSIIIDLYANRIAFLKSLPTFGHFGRGWMDRCLNGKQLALHLSKIHQASAKAIHPTGPTKTVIKPTGFFQSIINFLFRR